MLKAAAILSHIVSGMMVFIVIWILWMIFTRETHAEWDTAVTSPDGEVAELNEAKLNQCAAGVKVVWTSNTDLEIHYLESGWTEVPDAKVRVRGRWISVKLVPYSGDVSARCGSMKGRS